MEIKLKLKEQKVMIKDNLKTMNYMINNANEFTLTELETKENQVFNQWKEITTNYEIEQYTRIYLNTISLNELITLSTPIITHLLILTLFPNMPYALPLLLLYISALDTAFKKVKKSNFLKIKEQIDCLNNQCCELLLNPPKLKMRSRTTKEALTTIKEIDYETEFKLFYETNKEILDNQVLRKYQNIFKYYQELKKQGLSKEQILSNNMLKDKYANEIGYEDIFNIEINQESQKLIRMNVRNKFIKLFFSIEKLPLKNNNQYYDKIRYEFFDEKHEHKYHIHHWVDINKEIEMIENIFNHNPTLQNEFVTQIKNSIDSGCGLIELKDLLIKTRKELEIIILSQTKAII